MTTNPDEFDALVTAWLMGELTPDQAARLGALVEADPVLRDRLLVLADLHACLATDERLWTSRQEPTQASRPKRRVPAAWAFAAGLLLGVVSVVFGFPFSGTGPQPSLRPLPLVDGDFESGDSPHTTGLPNRTGLWGGDFSTIVTGSDQGISPFKGRRMFRFLQSDFEGERFTRSATGEVFQVVDLREWPRPSSPVAVEVAGWVNAVRVMPGEDYRWVVHVFAFETDPTTRRGEADYHWLYRDCLAAAHRRDVPDDGDPSAWQRISAELLVPSAANYLVVSFGVVRARPAPTADPVQFPGHYLDLVEVTPMIPTPNRRW